MRFPPLILVLLPVLPLLSSHAISSDSKVEIDFTEKSQPLPDIWNSTGFSPADIVSTPEMKAVLVDLGSLGNRSIKYIRPHYLLNLTEAQNMDTDHPEYDWSRLDQTLDVITQSGLKLIFELMGFPADGSDNAESSYDKNFQEQLVHRKSYFNDLKSPQQIRKWKEFIKALALHLENRYGSDQVRSWIFESTNEPNRSNFWSYSQEVFLNYYDACSEGLRAADPKLSFGGPGTANPELNGYFTALMDHCAIGKNFLTGEKGVRIDFISVHVKDQPIEIVAREMKCINYIRDHDPSLISKPFINDEADPVVGWAKTYWWECGPWYASFIVQNIDLHQRLMGPSRGIDYRLFSSDNAFLGTWDQRTTHSLFREQATDAGFTIIRKPVLTVMKLISGLGTKLFTARIPASIADHFGVIPSMDDKRISILVYNKTSINIDKHPKPEPDDELAVMKSQEVESSVVLRGISSNSAKLEIQRIDEQHGNPYRLWVEMGRPKLLSKKQVELLKGEESPKIIDSRKIFFQNHELVLKLNVPSPSVSLITIDPDH